MSCVHFKFKSSLEYEKITFDGLHISLADLKDAIMKQKKIGLSNAFKLEVVDAQSKKGVCVYVCVCVCVCVKHYSHKACS